MTTQYEIVVEQSDGSLITYIVFDNGNGSTSMPKAVWDELEAAKENGTISQVSDKIRLWI